MHLKQSLWAKRIFSKKLLIKFRLYSSLNFVPKHEPAKVDEVVQLQKFISNNNKLVVITGAGISTESGIPDYRSEGVGLYATSPTRPVQYKHYLESDPIRRRYWARNYVGWPRFSNVQPNTSHIYLSQWEAQGKPMLVVTQNVDRLHTKAGSKDVIELHGSAYSVVCISCDYLIDRHDFQNSLAALNPTLKVSSTQVRPDGDVNLKQDEVESFNIPYCPNCSGILKPDIVFFGDNVPRPKVDFVYKRVEESDGVLVIGSSLEVYSAYRFLLAASEQNKPIAIVNIGRTRGDRLASVKVSSRSGEVLPLIKVN